MIRAFRLAWLALTVLACTDVTTELIGSAGPDTSVRAPDAAQVADSAAGDSSMRERVLCGNRACACDNGEDDDGDDAIDGLDQECTGPYDDDESTFATGIPGNSVDFCQDCYWDDNSGSEDDGCQYNTECLFGRAPTGPSNAGCFQCQVSAQCTSTCAPRTPNGCDCFGCCEVMTSDGPTNVLLRDTCSLSQIDDPDKCPRCTKSAECQNPCGTCELCPGRKRKDLPPECRGQGAPTSEDPSNVCDEGQQVCSEDTPCPRDYYCQLGCCLFILH